MVHQEENAALLALRGGLRGRFRRSFDCMENAPLRSCRTVWITRLPRRNAPS